MKNIRYQVLDGWRGVSIIFVLAGHLLPMGPRNWQMNAALAATGMALFFILSGFLITNILLTDQNVGNFLIKRLFRIVPLAWLCLLITLVSVSADINLFLPHLLFYANWEPIALIEETGVYWSLCVEMQFYLLMSILVFLFKRKAFLFLPILCVAITVNRYLHGVEIAINTYYRLDEILAGCMLALICTYGVALKRSIAVLSPIYMLPILIWSSHPNSGAINYFRPYVAMLLVGATLFDSSSRNRWLNNKNLIYVANISYALYLIHGGLVHTWLGEGEKVIKYIKRPVLFAITFLAAHCSTFYYEKYWNELAKKLVLNSKKVIN